MVRQYWCQACLAPGLVLGVATRVKSANASLYCWAIALRLATQLSRCLSCTVPIAAETSDIRRLLPSCIDSKLGERPWFTTRETASVSSLTVVVSIPPSPPTAMFLEGKNEKQPRSPIEPATSSLPSNITCDAP